VATATSTSRPAEVKITPATLKEWAKLDLERLELNRQAEAIKVRQAQILDAAFAHAKIELGRKFKPGAFVMVGKFKIEVGTGRRNVAWKDLFIARAGEQAAIDAINAVTPPLTIDITTPGPRQS
jgi:hypothetical protein